MPGPGPISRPHPAIPFKRDQVLKGRVLPSGKSCFDGRPGAELPPFNFEDEKQSLMEQHGSVIRDVDVMVRHSHALDTYTPLRSLSGS